MDNETKDMQPARTERPPPTDWAADVQVDFVPSTPSVSSQSQTSVDAGGEGVAGTPVAASQAAASLDAAPATGAAASTVDHTLPPSLPPTLSPSPTTTFVFLCF